MRRIFFCCCLRTCFCDHQDTWIILMKHSLGSWSSWLAIETLRRSPPEIPGKKRPPITLWATWVRLSSAMTADTCAGARGQRSGDKGQQYRLAYNFYLHLRDTEDSHICSVNNLQWHNKIRHITFKSDNVIRLFALLSRVFIFLDICLLKGQKEHSQRAEETLKSHLLSDSFSRMLLQGQQGCVGQTLLHCEVTQQVVTLEQEYTHKEKNKMQPSLKTGWNNQTWQ